MSHSRHHQGFEGRQGPPHRSRNGIEQNDPRQKDDNEPPNDNGRDGQERITYPLGLQRLSSSALLSPKAPIFPKVRVGRPLPFSCASWFPMASVFFFSSGGDDDDNDNDDDDDEGKGYCRLSVFVVFSGLSRGCFAFVCCAFLLCVCVCLCVGAFV